MKEENVFVSDLSNVGIIRFGLKCRSNLQFAGSEASCVTDGNVSGCRANRHNNVWEHTNRSIFVSHAPDFPKEVPGFAKSSTQHTTALIILENKQTTFRYGIQPVSAV